MDKFGKMEINWTVVIGVLAAAYFLVPGFQATVNGLFGGVTTPSTPGTPSVPTIDCIHDGVTMTLGPTEKKWDPGTAVTGVNDRVLINGKDRGVQQDGATMDTNYKDNVVIYYNWNESTTILKTYYTSMQELTVPCTSAFSSGDESADGDAYQLIASQLPTLTAFNDDDGLLNTGGTNSHSENISASDSANIKVKLIQAAKTGYSPYGEIPICARYNTSLYTTVELSGISDNVGEIKKDVAVPTVLTNNGALGSKAGFTVKCWSIKGLADINTVTQEYNLYLVTGSVYTDVGDDAVINGVILSLLDEEYFRNTETGKIEIGPSTNLFAEVGRNAIANISINLSG